MDIVKVVTALVVGYALGSLNTAIIVGKMYGQEIVKHGSKSAGLTNSLRILGRTAALLVLTGDILKGVAACLFGLWLGVYAQSNGASDCISLLAAGTGAVLGHNWPVYFSFKGGKGALTAAAVMFMVNWQITLVSLAIFVLVVAATRYVSLGTICAVLSFLVVSFTPFFHVTLYFHAFAFLLATVIVLKHSSNIERLCLGRESKLGS